MTGEGIGGPLARVDRCVLTTFVVGATGAAAGGYLLLHGSLVVALAFCALPLVAWLFGRPVVGVVLLGAAIPVLYDLTGGRGGFHLAISDVLLVLVGASVIFGGALTGSTEAMQALRPLKGPLVQYGVFLAVLLIVHFSFKDAAQTGQRVELFVIPLLVGAFAVLADREFLVLKAYVVTASALAILWAVTHSPSLGQKNPIGQMIGNALLLLVGVKSLRSYAPLALVLVPGMLLTGSRGAVVGTAVGLLVILALQDSRARALFTRLSLVAVVAFVAYALLPVSLQSRLTSFSAGTGSRAAYANHIRQQYIADAKHLIAKHPVVGIGVGNYVAGNPRNITSTTDPHNVLLLQAAEGGYGFALSFVVLIGAVGLLLRKIRQVALAPVAAGVFLATVTHGLVDVYWVRATPVLGWLLVGMACAMQMNREGSPEEA
ncbi:MAG: O-antigen ligase family protein [Gaiellaceae bacterium]